MHHAHAYGQRVVHVATGCHYRHTHTNARCADRRIDANAVRADRHDAAHTDQHAPPDIHADNGGDLAAVNAKGVLADCEQAMRIDMLAEAQLCLVPFIRWFARNGHTGWAFKLVYIWQWVDREMKDSK